MTNIKDRAGLRALCEGATEGPWHIHRDFECKDCCFISAKGDYICILDGKPNRLANAQLIVASRAAIPLLLDRIDELERVMGVMEKTIRFIRHRDAMWNDNDMVAAALSEHAKLMEGDNGRTSNNT